MRPSVVEIALEDIPRGAATLTRGFRGDPFFTYIFGDLERYDRCAPWMFGTWIRWCIRYGRAWTTPGFEAVALRRVPGRYDMSLWTLFRAGILASPLRIGPSSFQRFATLVRLMEKRHEAIMKQQPHWYCQTIAALPEVQGQGFGRALMQHTFALADAERVPCYLETTTPRNVEIHQRQGYEVKEVIEVPGSDLVLTLMVRQPR